MNRKQFIRSILLVIIGIAFGNMTYGIPQEGEPVLVSVSGSDVAKMYQKGIDELGGIKNFIRKGDRVVIKPNILSNTTPNLHQTTNPELIKMIVEQCYEADARIVSVFEHSNDSWTKCYKNSGIERATKDARARVLPANEEFYFTEVSNTKASILQSVKIHNSLVDCDVLINLCVFNPNTEANISGAIKNLQGCIWDKNFYQENGMETCLAEFLYYKKPALNIMEIYSSAKSTEVIITQDIVTADSYANQINTTTKDTINHISIAHKLGFGVPFSSATRIKQLKE